MPEDPFELAEFYQGQDGCLNALIGDPAAGQEPKSRATDVLLDRNEYNVALLQRMRNVSWLYWLEHYAATSEVRDLCDALLLMTYHRDSEIRALACETLRTKLPCRANDLPWQPERLESGCEARSY